MRPTCLLAALAMSVLGASRASADTPLIWRIDKFANEFWVLDKLSGWNGDDQNAYVVAFEKRFKLDDARRQALRRFAEVRRAHAEGAEQDVWLLPPTPGPAEHFAIAFFEARDEAAAATALKLTGSELTAVTTAFKVFRKDIDTLIADFAYLETAKRTLVSHAKTARLGEYLDTMKAFYAIDDAAPYTVNLLWAPPGYSEATVWGNEIVLPVPAQVSGDAKTLAIELGVVVHELGHAFLGAKPDAVKAELSRRIVDSGGILNHHHENIIDEATQTALGNILFTRTRLPDGYDARSFYNYEPDNEYPDAIDTLARAFEPLAQASLATRDGFATVYLPKALALQRTLFRDKPLHHAHVALVFLANDNTAAHFGGLFSARSGKTYGPPELTQFVTDSHAKPTMTRWILLTQSEATPALVGKLEVPVAKSTTLGENVACARAARRGVDAGYDVFVIGRDGEALRRILIELHRVQAMPEAKLLCLAD